MPTTLEKILVGLVGAVSGWQPTTSLVNDLADGILLLNTAHTALPASPLVSAIWKAVTQTGAGVANVENGQLAEIGAQSASFPGYGEDDVLIFAVRKYKNGGAPAGSPAEALKSLNGY